MDLVGNLNGDDSGRGGGAREREWSGDGVYSILAPLGDTGADEVYNNSYTHK